jgi:hypothetical protein
MAIIKLEKLSVAQFNYKTIIINKVIIHEKRKRKERFSAKGYWGENVMEPHACYQWFIILHPLCSAPEWSKVSFLKKIELLK